jgi:hypothetical protein
MIVNDLDVFGAFTRPPKANPELVIDPDAPLALAVPAQFLKPVSGRHAKVAQILRQIQLDKLSKHLPFDLRPPAHMAQPEELFGVLRPKGLNHGFR